MAALATDDLFARAREAADFEKVAGVKLYKVGSRWRGPCPLCKAGEGKTLDGPFSWSPGAERWNCFSCGEPAKGVIGDVVELYARLARCGLREAAEQLAGAAPAGVRAAQPAPARETPRPDNEAWKARLALRLWRESGQAAGTPVESYLRARCLGGEVLDRALACLRFHPAAYHSGGRDAAVLLPAMVGLVFAPAGPSGGVHVTYLAPDGRGKTARAPAKRMWGPQGRDGRWGAVWLSPPDAAGPLVVAEGIESALSAAMLLDGPCRCVAALSLDRLSGRAALDRYGRLDPAMVRADPERPAFVWPDPGEVIVCVDRDMRPLRNVAMRKATGGTWRGELDGEARARICAGLAAQAWRAAGANPVRTWAPGMGRDFNDELKAREGMA